MDKEKKAKLCLEIWELFDVNDVDACDAIDVLTDVVAAMNMQSSSQKESGAGIIMLMTLKLTRAEMFVKEKAEMN